MNPTDWLSPSACNSYSQFGEDGILQAIFSVIGTQNKWCLECGAADGLFFSNTRRLIEQGWYAVLVEADRREFGKLAQNSKAFGARVKCLNLRVGDESGLDEILADCGAPLDIDLVVIDVDGQDFYLFNAIHRFRPRVVVIEFALDADENFLPTLGGSGQAGVGTLMKLAAGKFYTPVFRTLTNLILVRQPLDNLVLRAEIEPKTI